MNKIAVKQVEGAVDLSSAQRIEGDKSFNNIVITPNPATGPFMKIDGNFIYWLQHENILNEIGNMRIGIENGGFLMQSFQDVWTNV